MWHGGAALRDGTLTDPIVLYGWTDTELAWRRRARCADLGDAMFPNGDPELTRQAATVCRACPVIVECDSYAREHRIKDGVWGGRSRVRLRVSGHSS
jgi:WhiB family redox-sensing transcriptional regulator